MRLPVSERPGTTELMHKVYLTNAAQQDLLDLYQYVERNDIPGNADYVLDQLQQLVESLVELPTRGAVVKELALLGIHEYRELYFKLYRVIYRQLPSGVYVYLIADGRRNMQSLLQRRLLG
jgi:toxin ParE1/3/4